MHAGSLLWRFSSRARGRFGPESLGLVLRAEGGSVDWDPRMEPEVATASLPKWCLRGDGAPPLGAIVAVLDEMSTYAGVAGFDALGRPGVSLTLEARLARDPPPIDPDSRLRFVTSARKCGKTIAFLDVDVFDERTGRLVATGTHTKFLPTMGVVLDQALGRCRPVVQPLAEAYLRLTRKKPRVARSSEEGPQSRDTVFPLRREDGDVDRLDVTDAHSNPIGALHGGAAVMVAELAAHRRVSPGAVPRAISATLMSALRPGQTATIVFRDDKSETDNEHHIALLRGSSPVVDARVRF